MGNVVHGKQPKLAHFYMLQMYRLSPYVLVRLRRNTSSSTHNCIQFMTVSKIRFWVLMKSLNVDKWRGGFALPCVCRVDPNSMWSWAPNCQRGDGVWYPTISPLFIDIQIVDVCELRKVAERFACIDIGVRKSRNRPTALEWVAEYWLRSQKSLRSR